MVPTVLRAVAPDGESVVFQSLGAFAGSLTDVPAANYYVARRGVSGWTTAPTIAPAALSPEGALQTDFSATLELSLSGVPLGPNHENAVIRGGTEEYEFLLHGLALPYTAASFEVAAGMVFKAGNGGYHYLGGSPDFSHILFDDIGQPGPLLPEAERSGAIYDLETQSLGGAPLLMLVALDNAGKMIDPSCEVELGARSGKGSKLNAVAADGGEVFFTACSGQLYGRVARSRTLELAKGQPAEFQGASEDGSKVFFTTGAPLDLYMAQIGCPGGEEECVREPTAKEVTGLVQVSHGGEPAEVQGVVALAPDGSHVYFVARGVLGGSNREGASPVKGADNLYVYDSASGGPPVFIADLCSASGLSGGAEDLRCQSGLHESYDTGLWTSPEPEAQVNVCSRLSASECVGERETGRFLVFSSYAQLTADDTDTAKDVYRYDAASGSLERVSAGEGGTDANGNNDSFDATIAKSSEQIGQVYLQHGLNSRAISEDGAWIVFDTAEPLSPAAANGLANAYEWHGGGSGEGRVSLVSTGSSSQAVEDVVIGSGGGDVFFATTQGLVPQDTDGQLDVYDARLGGGFPQPPAGTRPCSGDACQGPLTNPAPLLVPGSVSQAPASPPAKKTSSKAKKAKTRKRKAPAKKARKRRAKRAKRVSARGNVTAGRWVR